MSGQRKERQEWVGGQEFRRRAPVLSWTVSVNLYIIYRLGRLAAAV